jgi:biopolymer transport protein ExbB
MVMRSLNRPNFAPASVTLILAAVFAVVAVLIQFDVPPALAQDNDVISDEEAAPAAAPVRRAEDAPTTESAAPRRISYLNWAYKSLGIGYSLVFLALSFTLVALIVMNLLGARRDNIVPSDLIEGFEAHLNSKQYQEAYELARNDESVLGKVLSAGLAKLSAGYGPAIEAMQEVGEEENMKLEHRLSYMALIGSISPMIGLFGTVHGMIRSFNVIATATTAPKPSELAEGISTALFTTLVGLMIAIPAIAAYSILRNWVARLVLEVGIVSENLMSRFQTVGGGKKQP